MTAPRAQPLSWLLDRSTSCFVPLIWRRVGAGDKPADPAKVFRQGRAWFGLIEWPDGRWLVLPIDHGCAPTPQWSQS